MHRFKREPRNNRKIWILQYCPKDFCPGLWLHETRETDLTRAHWRATPARASAFKCPVISNFEIYFQDFQEKKLGCDKCLAAENLHLRHLPFLGNSGQRYLWIDKSNGGLSCWPPRLIFSLCQQLFNYRKIQDDFACTVSLIYFVLNSWSTK